ncbi:DUF6519 domain-containing protein [Pseudoxanthomonas sp. 10H]|uniref:DUF6519 domain-containing protein n=1 Tax=Pseudoxanthomonas sp. 10H TaxID=3242729 RepID=UPI003558FD91
MATDLSRIRHDPLLDWAGVQLKQGGVLLDADANELVAVLDRRLRALAGDVLGRSTVSQTTPDAFRIVPTGGGDLDIGRGRLYVDGLLAENHGGGAAAFDSLLAEPRRADPVRYSAQPYLPQPPPLPTAGRHLVYLDVWQREVTALEAPGLVESAVGVDASSRLQTVWQVRVLDADAGAASSCATPDGELPGWAEVIAPSGGRLTTGTFEVPSVQDPCELPPTGGYRGLENQLYRVEIHDPGLPGAGATFKWSRENASVGARVANVVSATELELDSLGRDDVLGFADGDWVEVLDDARELSGLPGEMRRIDIPDPSNRRIGFAPALPAALAAGTGLRVRRWDQKGRVFRAGAGGTTVQVQDLDAPASTGVIAVPAAGTELLLENGVTVSFSNIGAAGFRRGDWWVFAARTADASVEELQAAPPRGIHHHYARLGIWDVGTGITDCRQPWPPSGGDDCGCTQCVSAEDHNSGRLTIQTAVDRLRDTGGTVCLKPGNYLLTAPVLIAGGRSIAIRGQGSATVITAPGTAFRVESAMAVAIEKLAVLSLGRESAIEARTVLGLALRELLVFVFQNSDLRNAAISLGGLCAGVTIRDNLILASDGIRTDTGQRGDAPALALLAALEIEHNVLSCQRRGIALDGPVAWLWDNRIAANQLLNCRNGGVLAGGLAVPAASLHVVDNNLGLQGSGITCALGGAWISGNKLVFQNTDNRTGIFDGIALTAGLNPAGVEQVHVLANQVEGFTGTGIAVRAPVRDLVVKLNIVSRCGNGIVMEEDAESDSASIENNHVRGILGTADASGAGIAAGISLLRTASATVAGNQVHEIGTGGQLQALWAGIAASGVVRTRIAGNEVSRIGPAVRAAGRAVGILVRTPFEQTEIAGNSVRRDDETQPDESMWYALVVQDGRRAPANTLTNRAAGSVAHATGMTTVGLDDRRTLVITGTRAYIASAKPGLAAAAAAAGSVALVNGNSLSARGSVPAVELQLGAEVMFSSNRCELAGSGRVPGVAILAPLLVFSSNRVACAGDVGATLTAGAATVLGNATTSPIRLNNAPLAAPWNALNVAG